MSVPLTDTNLDNILPLIAKGKVRDIYEVNDSTLLFIATDRISAYDVVMENPIPDKGAILTKISEFWFDFFKNDIENHLMDIPQGKTLFDYLPSELYTNEKYRSQIENRSLLVVKHKLIPLEVIVRGFITGSAWKEYLSTGTVHGIKQAENLQESQEFPQAIFTPSTKAEQGDKDENITVEQAQQMIGKDLCGRLGNKAIELYCKAKEYAKTRGIIIADTKFEFGIKPNGDLVLVDEVLTPDSSRFWGADNFVLGKSQDSFDKQFLRNWLTSNKLNGVEGVKMPQDIVEKTRTKYLEALEKITGEKL
ncbi:Bifunctional purine biosynthetic protein ade1 [Hanseniaspora osmophila]